MRQWMCAGLGVKVVQNELHALCLWLPTFHPTVYFNHTYTLFFSTCTFEIMFVVFFRLFSLCAFSVCVCDNSFFVVVAPLTSSSFFQFCFILIMGSTKGNAIAILFVTSMVSFGAYLCELAHAHAHAEAAHFDKATSARRKNTMTITQSVKQN